MTITSKALAIMLAGVLLVPAFANAEDTAAPSPATPPMAGEMKGPGPGHRGFEEADINKDGALSLDEFLARHKQKFAEIDIDKNGSLSKEEMKTFGDSKREEWKERQEKMKDAPKDTPAPGAAPAQ